MNIRPLPCPPDLHAERDAIAKAVADSMTVSGEFDGGLAWVCENDTRVAFWQTLGTASNDSAQYTKRFRIPSVLISQHGRGVQLLFKAGSGTFTIQAAYIGKAGTGLHDFDGNQKQLLFSGSGSTSISSGSEKWSDVVDFEFGQDDDLVISWSGQTGYTYFNISTTLDKGIVRGSKAGLDSSTTIASGYGGITPGQLDGVAAIRVSGASYDETGDYLSGDDCVIDLPDAFYSAAGTIAYPFGGSLARRRLIDGYDISNATTTYGMFTTQPRAGQAFTLSEDVVITHIRIALQPVGSPPSGDVTAAIFNTTGTVGTNASPSGDALFSSAAIPSSRITTSMWCGFDANVKLNAGDYALAARYALGDISNHIAVKVDGSSLTHGGNVFSETNGSSAYDACFELYGFTPRDTRRVQPYLLWSSPRYLEETASDVAALATLSADATGGSPSTSASNVVDGSTSTYIQFFSYLTTQFATPKIITKISFYIGTAGNDIIWRAKTLKASNDGSNWDTIHTFADVAGAAGWNEFVISNEDAYLYYKLDRPGSSGDGASLWEMQMYASEWKGGADYRNDVRVDVGNGEKVVKDAGDTITVGADTYNILRAPLQRIDHMTQALSQCRVHLRNNEQRLKAVVLVEEN